MRKRYGLNPSIFAAALVTVMCLAAVARVGASEKSGKIIEFKGTCDGSAAVRIRGDTLLVAYDEKNLLYTYSVSGGKWKRDEEIGDKLALLRNKKDSEMEEMDLEGAAQDGKRIWWVGSHGLDGSKKDRPNRRTLFATNVPSKDLDDLKIKVRRVDLTAVLLTDKKVSDRLPHEVRKRAPKKGGINIEGLALHSEGELLLGFRSPLSDSGGMSGDAMVVHIARANKSLKIKAVHSLDLGNRGVRDIVRHKEGYLVLAGPVFGEPVPGIPDPGFALYRWDGQSAPVQISTTALDGLNPEALVQLENGWLVLSDDGKVKRPNNKGKMVECDDIRKGDKEDPNVFFRARRFELKP